jgi:lipoyl(octanoyl) transferase
MANPLIGVWLGRRRYAPIEALQRELFELRKRGELRDVVLLLEHEPVITLGRGAHPEHLLESRELLLRRGIDVAETDRGGEITLHAPGQLVCYPIVGLAPDRCDVRRYVKDLTATMRELIAPARLEAGEMPGLVGLWVDAKSPAEWKGDEHAAAPVKIGAIGVKLSRWVSMHGFALNLSIDLSLYRLIVPCGVTQYGVCSVESLRGSSPSPSDVAPRAHSILSARLERALGALLDASAVPSEELGAWIRARAVIVPQAIEVNRQDAECAKRPRQSL